MCDVANAKTDWIGSMQLATDGEVKQSQVFCLFNKLQSFADCPDLFQLVPGLLSYLPASVRWSVKCHFFEMDFHEILLQQKSPVLVLEKDTCQRVADTNKSASHYDAAITA